MPGPPRATPAKLTAWPGAADRLRTAEGAARPARAARLPRGARGGRRPEPAPA
ncbi:hypothetical protein SSBG_05293 [Streptomyces sp. SPB074]|nr:hypothetical protein SSBG_05293 [Streptomyces sp. SPB074]